MLNLKDISPSIDISSQDQLADSGGMRVSIVIPVYNEAENLPLLHDSLTNNMAASGLIWEVIYVDDGSRDSSLAVLEELATKDTQHVTVVSFRRNFGQTAAIAAGIDHTQGDVIVLMDADLQNDPVDIPMMIGKIKEGYDVVSGWRINRQDKLITRKLPSNTANWLISSVTGVRLHDYGCTLKAYRREVLTGFRLYGEMHRFIPAYASSVGANIIEVPVQHHARKFGKTKYGLNRTLKVVLDLFTVKFLISYSSKPIYLFGGFGIVMMAISTITLLLLLIRRQVYGIGMASSPFFLVSITMMIMGFQSVLMGLLAELLARTYHESQQKPTYFVRRVIKHTQGLSQE